jgi:hypothetical protein
MKKLLITTTAIAAFASSAGAMESMERTVTDPLYQPMEGKWLLDIDFQAFQRDYDRFNITTRVFVDQWQETGGTTTFTAQYGIVDSFAIDFGIGWTAFEQSVTPNNASTVNYDYIGWENPFIGLTYKLFDNKAGVLQFGGQYTFDAFDAQKTTSTAYDGSAADGRQEIEGFVRYGKDWKWFTIAPSAIARYLGSERYVILNGDQNHKYDDAMEYEFRLDHEIRIGHYFSLNPNFAYITRDERDYENRAGATNDKLFQEDNGNLVTSRIQANIHFNDLFTLSGYYEYQFIEGDDTAIRKRTGGGAVPPYEHEDEVNQLVGIKTIFEF